jgi:hypothetical protein
MADIPPSLKKDNHNITEEFINNLIKSCFEETPLTLVEKHSDAYNYYNQNDKVYLKSASVREIVSVQIVNRQGGEIKYTPNLSTGYYQNYIKLNRELLSGEELHIKYLANPAESDFFTQSRKDLYLTEDIYKELIKRLHTYAKGCAEILNNKNNKELNKDGKN